jgi:hypothetical protein
MGRSTLEVQALVLHKVVFPDELSTPLFGADDTLVQGYLVLPTATISAYLKDDLHEDDPIVESNELDRTDRTTIMIQRA